MNSDYKKWECEITAPPELHEPIQELFDAISWKLKHVESSSTQFTTDKNVGDTINRKMAIDALCHCQTYLFDSRDDDKKISLEDAEYAIEQLPSAQPERKIARWEILYPNHTYKYHCSECGANHKYMFDFCPSCGARMED